MNGALFLLAYVSLLLLGAGVALGGAWSAAPLLFVYLLLPVADALIGRSLEDRAAISGRRLFDLPLWLWAPAQLAATASVLLVAAGGERPALELAGLVISLGLVSASGGINVAHELMHRSGRAEQATAELLMSLVGYPHFCVEHVHGHHRHVATPRDPASARLGESLYRFLLRAVPGALRSAWRIESERVCRSGAAWTLGDRRLRYPLQQAALCSGVALGFGSAGLVALLAQGALAVLLLETINYLEHYGLCRRELAPGRYERVRPEHSWNASFRVSNGYLFNLARHSDHHFQASRPYEQLRHHDDAPQLPAGYATMMLVAWLPPLWFRVMDSRARAWSRRGAVA